MATKKPVKKRKKKTPRKKPPGKFNLLDWFQNGKAFVPLLIIAILAVYFPAFDKDFVNYDDNWYITENPYVLNFSFSSIWEFFTNFYHAQYSPVPMLLVAVEYLIAGEHTLLYNIISILIHIANALLIFQFTFLLVKNRSLAFFVALIFSIHPMNAEAVAWLAASKKVGLFTLFFFLSLIWYIKYLKHSTNSNYLVALLLFCLSWFCKEQAVFLAPTLIAIDYYFGRNLLERRVILEKIPFFGLALIFGIIAFLATKSYEVDFIVIDYSLSERFTFASMAFFSYLWKTLIPVNLSAYYPYPDVEVLPVYMKAVMIVPVLFFSALFFALKKRKKLIAFGLLFFLINISFTLIFQIISVRPTIMADRYVYIASVGLFIILIDSLFKLVKLKKIPVNFIWLISGVYLLFLAFNNFSRSQVWNNSGSLWESVISSYPETPKALYNLGCFYYDNKDYTGAIPLFDRAIAADPSFVEALNNKGLALMDQGKHSAALENFNLAISVKNSDPDFFFNKGFVLNLMNRPAEAIGNFDKAIELDQNYHSAYLNKGIAHLKLNQYEKALQDYATLDNIYPNYILMYMNRSEVFFRQGKNDLAIKDLDTALRIDPGYYKAYANKGAIYIEIGDFQKAQLELSNCLNINPNSDHALYWRGFCEFRLGRMDKAVSDISQAITINPNVGEYFHQRSKAYKRLGQLPSALQDAQSAQQLGIRIEPSFLNSLK